MWYIQRMTSANLFFFFFSFVLFLICPNILIEKTSVYLLAPLSFIVLLSNFRRITKRWPHGLRRASEWGTGDSDWRGFFAGCADYEIRNFVLPEKQYFWSSATRLLSLGLFFNYYYNNINIYLRNGVVRFTCQYREAAVPHLRPHLTRWGFSRVITWGLGSDAQVTSFT